MLEHVVHNNSIGGELACKRLRVDGDAVPSRKLAETTRRVEAHILNRIGSHDVAEFAAPATDINNACVGLEMS